MVDDRKFIKKVLQEKDFVHKEANKAVRCWFVVHNEYGGYVEQDYTFHKWLDGSITISENDGNGFISIRDKEIIEILKGLLND